MLGILKWNLFGVQHVNFVKLYNSTILKENIQICICIYLTAPLNYSNIPQNSITRSMKYTESLVLASSDRWWSLHKKNIAADSYSHLIEKWHWVIGWKDTVHIVKTPSIARRTLVFINSSGWVLNNSMCTILNIIFKQVTLGSRDRYVLDWYAYYDFITPLSNRSILL